MDENDSLMADLQDSGRHRLTTPSPVSDQDPDEVQPSVKLAYKDAEVQ